MEKAGNCLPRRRGRPKVDRATAIADVLVKWLEIDQPGRPGIRKAVRDVVPRKIAGGYKTRREALYDALRDIGRERALRWAIEAAEARGAAVPAWARDDLAAAEAANRQYEAEFTASAEHFKPIIEAQLERFSGMVPPPFAGKLDKYMREAEHVRRLVAFGRAFADIFPSDTPISVIARAFVAARQAALRSAAGVLDLSKQRNNKNAF